MLACGPKRWLAASHPPSVLRLSMRPNTKQSTGLSVASAIPSPAGVAPIGQSTRANGGKLRGAACGFAHRVASKE